MRKTAATIAIWRECPPKSSPRATAQQFREKMLITHRGLSGPAILQISSYWKAPSPIYIDLAPGQRSDCRLSRSQSPRSDEPNLRSTFHEFFPVALPIAGSTQRTPNFQQSRARRLWNVAPTGGKSLPQVRKDMRRPKLQPEESIPANSPPKPWRAAKFPACFSSVKSWMLPANSEDSTSNGLGRPAFPPDAPSSSGHPPHKARIPHPENPCPEPNYRRNLSQSNETCS